VWIIPRQLISVSALDTKESALDSKEFSQAAEQSLLWRSKPSPSQTWLARWKREPIEENLKEAKSKRGGGFVDGWR